MANAAHDGIPHLAGDTFPRFLQPQPVEFLPVSHQRSTQVITVMGKLHHSPRTRKPFVQYAVGAPQQLSLSAEIGEIQLQFQPLVTQTHVFSLVALCEPVDRAIICQVKRVLCRGSQKQVLQQLGQ